MAICFVIQPFDRGKFDKRYQDTFKPAIEAAGLEPYRVDDDPAVEIPIEEIERGIRRAEVCLAEISTDNPNVWYELGFAFAARKAVVMVCSDEREDFPFDVQHRAIVRYRSEAVSDFKKLQTQITERLKAAVKRKAEMDDVAEISPVAPTAGLSQHEIAALIAIASYNAVPAEPPSFWTIQQDMNRAGFTDIAVTLATRGLIAKGLVAAQDAIDPRDGVYYEGVEVTEKGLEWLQENEHRLVLREPPDLDAGDDLPF